MTCPAVRLFPLVFPLALAACSGFSTVTMNDDMLPFPSATVTFDRTLPRAIEEVMGTCLDPLSISEFPLKATGACDSYTDLQSPEAQLLWIALSTQPPIDASAAFASAKDALVEVYHIDGLPFPFQGCDVFLDVNMTILGLSFTNADASWVTHGGLPAFTLDLDPTRSSTGFAQGAISRNVDCPNPFNEPIVAGFVPNGVASIQLDNVDLDVWFDLTFSGNKVTATTQVALDFSHMRLDPPLAPIVENSQGTFEQIVAAQTGTSMDELKAQANRTLASRLSSVRDQIEKLIEDAVPDGHAICSLAVVNGKLTMLTHHTFCPPPLVLGN
jgi:hypothetical protein